MTAVAWELALGNRIIDEAATEAGRYPRDIRRIFDCHGSFGQARQGFLQGPPTQWVEELLPLVIELGVSTFILVGDDPCAIQRFVPGLVPRRKQKLR